VTLAAEIVNPVPAAELYPYIPFPEVPVTGPVEVTLKAPLPSL
jgi:hypothetical protein